ncbi:MAG TPA: phage tail sheath subtilisin-like domain-containing protein [Longimicrobium sp.]|jgi:phage tail sheath protein FI|nr:phage tail sheath subtilisin-like domain-containing protein [Longimicrobium sp.]
MPQALTYPGVYIEEVPSGVRSISGVTTSIAAFVGWAARGDTDRATLVQSWQDYERRFGGLDSRSLLGYSVLHFFNNGGQQAYVVRLVATGAATASVVLDAVLTVTARNPGDWAKEYGVTARPGTGGTRFGLTISRVPASGPPVVEEVFENLSMDPADRRFVENVLEAESALVRVALVAGATTPPDTAGVAVKLAGAAGLDGPVLEPDNAPFETALGLAASTGGVNHLRRVDLFNLLCVPGETDPTTVALLQKFARDHRAFMIVDCAQGASFTTVQAGPPAAIAGDDGINAAFYFPWVKAPDPLRENRIAEYPPCGFVAGLYAKTDSTRGVWKAPAGVDASLSGVAGVREVLTDLENGTLNVQAINCLRVFPVYGTVVWGARTLRGNNELGSEWKYVPIRRLALFIEETLFRGTKWVVFEPNDEPLWAQIRLNVGAFMNGLFRQGAFQGRTPRDAYFVKCDANTTTQADRNLGIVNVLVGFAPLKPAEFVVIRIQQIAGEIQT